MSGNERAYVLGATNISVGASVTVEFVPPAGMQSGYIVPLSGTLGIGGATLSDATNGFVVPSGGVEVGGPAKFYLGAGAGAAVATVLIRGSAGATLG